MKPILSLVISALEREPPEPAQARTVPTQQPSRWLPLIVFDFMIQPSLLQFPRQSFSPADAPACRRGGASAEIPATPWSRAGRADAADRSSISSTTRAGRVESTTTLSAMKTASSMSCVTSKRRERHLAADLHHHVLQVDARLRINRGERLIEQKQFRLDHDRARQRATLLHAARQLPRIEVGGVFEIDGSQAHPARDRRGLALASRAVRRRRSGCTESQGKRLRL